MASRVHHTRVQQVASIYGVCEAEFRHYMDVISYKVVLRAGMKLRKIMEATLAGPTNDIMISFTMTQ